MSFDLWTRRWLVPHPYYTIQFIVENCTYLYIMGYSKIINVGPPLGLKNVRKRALTHQNRSWHHRLKLDAATNLEPPNLTLTRWCEKVPEFGKLQHSRKKTNEAANQVQLTKQNGWINPWIIIIEEVMNTLTGFRADSFGSPWGSHEYVPESDVVERIVHDILGAAMNTRTGCWEDNSWSP